MDSPESFGIYFQRLCQRLGKETASWARDNIVWAGIALACPPLAVYFRDRHHPIDWDIIRATLWLYLFALLIYLTINAVRTAWKLDQDRANVLSGIRIEEDAIREKLADLERRYLDEKPRLGFQIYCESGRRAWHEKADNLNAPACFCLEHLSGRVAEAVRIDPIPSLLGKFSLRFDAEQFVA